MTNYLEMDGPTMLYELGTDAMKWAEATCQRFPESGLTPDDLMPWYANAIMHAIDTTNGTVHNGEHAQWLIDNGYRPDGSKVTEK